MQIHAIAANSNENKTKANTLTSVFVNPSILTGFRAATIWGQTGRSFNCCFLGLFVACLPQADILPCGFSFSR